MLARDGLAFGTKSDAQSRPDLPVVLGPSTGRSVLVGHGAPRFGNLPLSRPRQQGAGPDDRRNRAGPHAVEADPCACQMLGSKNAASGRWPEARRYADGTSASAVGQIMATLETCSNANCPVCKELLVHRPLWHKQSDQQCHECNSVRQFYKT